jgi:hypothetical protein
MAQKAVRKLTVQPLPPVREFGNPNVTIHPSVEKGQIVSIEVESGTGKNKKSHIMFRKGEYVQGVHPNQAQFLFYLIIGALGTGRGSRQLGFASWAIENATREELKSLGKYDAIVEYNKRGGHMWYKISELLELCRIKTEGATRSFDRFPRPVAPPTARQSSEREVEVDLVL